MAVTFLNTVDVAEEHLSGVAERGWRGSLVGGLDPDFINEFLP